MKKDLSQGQIANLGVIEEQYQRYMADPSSVDLSWQKFFEGMEFSGTIGKISASPKDGTLRIDRLAEQFRRFGHLDARINPIEDERVILADELTLKALGFAESELDSQFLSPLSNNLETLREIIEAFRAIYCSRIGFEFMHIEDPAILKWFQKRLEPALQIHRVPEQKLHLLELLNKAEAFEIFLHTKYVGQKRFSIEGSETLIPMLSSIIEQGAKEAMTGFVIGMAHRGRLNVLANILQKPYSVIFQEFEDSLPKLLFEGSGDVKYHKGFSSTIQTSAGSSVQLFLAANSSCLESVDPVVLGRTKGMLKKGKTGAILIHGDAALAGQGVIYEILQFMKLPGYETQGTIHIAVNNQIGFTTLPEEGRSTKYCTDIALGFGCPVFHVNAEDPESCLFAAELAIDFRNEFKKDVFIDLNCYRKYGHNEGDEPAFTQPNIYAKIRAKKTIRELYQEALSKEGIAAKASGEEFKEILEAAMKRGKEKEPHLPKERYGSHWQEPVSHELVLQSFDSSAKESILRDAMDRYAFIPKEFHLHPKLQKWVQERKESLNGKIDWATAECLAFGSLLLQGVPIRLSGQDSERGTFSQRHAAWVDQKNGEKYYPYSHVAKDLFQVYNSPLSEYAVLGFEYGYTGAAPSSLVLWEAQYGDFSIGAQIVIDHYLASAEQKWASYSSLVVLLPHGYEGQGPEHSSGRIERFLQLCASDNLQIVNATTPAQYFHALRRQALRPIKKPLVMFTPKSLLRLGACTSVLQEFTQGSFEEVLKDPAPMKNAERVLFCSGKVFYDLLSQREKRGKNVAIFRIEQLYPVHEEKIQEALATVEGCNDFRWVQEEPKNMGAFSFIAPYIQAYLPKGIVLRYVGRAPSAVTATGSARQHKQELDDFLNEAFS